ncbi:MAG: hypothetical protein ACRDTF_06900 [Pseudonocardiaceae bacterium]
MSRCRPKSKETRGLETRIIVYGNRRRPHAAHQELKVDVRRGDVIDEDSVGSKQVDDFLAGVSLAVSSVLTFDENLGTDVDSAQPCRVQTGDLVAESPARSVAASIGSAHPLGSDTIEANS